MGWHRLICVQVSVSCLCCLCVVGFILIWFLKLRISRQSEVIFNFDGSLLPVPLSGRVLCHWAYVCPVILTRCPEFVWTGSGLQTVGVRFWHAGRNFCIRFIISYCCTFKYNNLFIHLAACLTTGPKPLTKRAVHIVRSRASCFRWEYPLLSLRSSSSFLRLIPRLPVTSPPPPLPFFQ
jgi:hypothetical protein